MVEDSNSFEIAMRKMYPNKQAITEITNALLSANDHKAIERFNHDRITKSPLVAVHTLAWNLGLSVDQSNAALQSAILNAIEARMVEQDKKRRASEAKKAWNKGEAVPLSGDRPERGSW